MRNLRSPLDRSVDLLTISRVGVWTGTCTGRGMAGVRRFSELRCWQLARDLHIEVFRLTSSAAFARDVALRQQVRDAASSARRNMAEGFGRRTHRDQAHFFATSLASLDEVEEELGEAVDLGYLAEDEIACALELKKRAFVAASRFRRSILDRPDPPWHRWRQARRKRPDI